MRYKFLEELESRVGETLTTKDRALISVVGGPGVGKSYFGRYMRKNGLGRFSKCSISVIDDSVIKLDFLYFFKRRLRLPCKGVDELRPFFNIIGRRKKIVFFINATPEQRITGADILLRLSTDEETREKRLRQRNGNDPEKLERFLNFRRDEKIKINYKYEIKAEV
jgi:hypothetical protein